MGRVVRTSPRHSSSPVPLALLALVVVGGFLLARRTGQRDDSAGRARDLQAHADRLFARLVSYSPSAFPHGPASWTDQDLRHLDHLARGLRPYEDHAGTAAHALHEIARIADALHPTPPKRLPTPDERPLDFDEFQQLYSEAYRRLDALRRGRAELEDPRWGQHAR